MRELYKRAISEFTSYAKNLIEEIDSKGEQLTLSEVLEIQNEINLAYTLYGIVKFFREKYTTRVSIVDEVIADNLIRLVNLEESSLEIAMERIQIESMQANPSYSKTENHLYS